MKVISLGPIRIGSKGPQVAPSGPEGPRASVLGVDPRTGEAMIGGPQGQERQDDPFGLKAKMAAGQEAAARAEKDAPKDNPNTPGDERSEGLDSAMKVVEEYGFDDAAVSQVVDRAAALDRQAREPQPPAGTAPLAADTSLPNDLGRDMGDLARGDAADRRATGQAANVLPGDEVPAEEPDAGQEPAGAQSKLKVGPDGYPVLRMRDFFRPDSHFGDVNPASADAPPVARLVPSELATAPESPVVSAPSANGGPDSAPVEPSAAEAPAPESPLPLTEDAANLLRTVDAGGVPAYITQNMRRIAAENGIPVTGSTSPNDVITALRGRGDPVSNLVTDAAAVEQEPPVVSNLTEPRPGSIRPGSLVQGAMDRMAAAAGVDVAGMSTDQAQSAIAGRMAQNIGETGRATVGTGSPASEIPASGGAELEAVAPAVGATSGEAAGAGSGAPPPPEGPPAPPAPGTPEPEGSRDGADESRLEATEPSSAPADTRTTAETTAGATPPATTET
ncbi:hypothetical protein HY024_00725, partial [Candidatus Curtissbacteria bacterium]|nr:hypothetical protein [Candidatus Curtissbacteria bacterium]